MDRRELRRICSCHDFVDPTTGQPIDWAKADYDVPRISTRLWLLRQFPRLEHLTNDKVSPFYTGNVTIDGVLFVLKQSSGKYVTNACGWRRVRSFAHRLLVICPECDTAIPVGRLRQHLKRRDHNV